MIAQDTNINLCLITDEGVTKKGLLKMQHNNGNVSLSFYPEYSPDPSRPKAQKRIAQIPDYVHQLSDFTMIEMDSKDRLIVTLSGSRSHCVLYFTRDNDIYHFLKYISGKVRLKNSDCNPCVYLLEPLDSTQNTKVTPFNSTSLPQSSPHASKAPSRVSLQKIKCDGLEFTTDENITKMSAEEYRALFDQDGRIIDKEQFPAIFYNKDIDLEVAGDLWKLLLNRGSQDSECSNVSDDKCAHLSDAEKTYEERRKQDEDNKKKYQAVKEQWETTTIRQWRNYPKSQQKTENLRSLVELLEDDLVKNQNLFSHFNHPMCVQKIAFNILLTLSIYNWDNAYYTEGLITFLSPFLDSFIKDADCDHVTKHNGEVVPIIDVESEIFWCFTKFYEHNNLNDLVRSSQPMMKPLLIAIGYILAENFPDLLQLLNQKHAFSLDFLRNDISKWFTTCFRDSDIRRLWVSILSFSSSFQFFQCFVVSLLFSLAPNFVEINPLNGDEFVKRFHTLKTKVSLNLLLKNTEQLIKKLHSKQQH
ncbi:RabGAP/TBC domain-containing protein [Histomonas meleagridis]|uniref:RabGAP/TBC domain-containing protein n=1 Tax=Histomonas meleagridis TaxID=135588 RepID=UPI00355AAC9C|nr:RabGAP/TBC domain-containing protein [Histomonas meleagridis]KAH0797872.1 RabGAP/TBC domain-containing protein [Histomonas meleagridis]